MFFCCNFKEQQGEVFVNPRQSMKGPTKGILQSVHNQDKIGNEILVISSNYQSLLQKCKKSKNPYVDDDFPANDRSLNYAEGDRKIQWKRISDLQPNYMMVSDIEVNVNNIKNNMTKNTQFLTAILCIAENPERIKNIFVDNFVKNEYGIYKVIVNINGVPKEMVIDDYIPVFSPSNRPVFCKINQRQIWMVLLQKAYAKVRGSYGNCIKDVFAQDIFQTFLIGPCFNYFIEEKITQKFQKQLWMNLVQSCTFDAPICTGSKKKELGQIGLENEHTYQIVNCIQIHEGKQTHRIMRIRNIWTQTTYKQKANINDKTFWAKIPREYKQIILPTSQYNTEFTMPYEMFLHYFSFLTICHIRRGFNYQFYQLKCKKRQPSFIKIDIKEKQQIYIALKVRLDHPKDNIKYIRAVIAGKNQYLYSYITSKIETQWDNLTIRAELLPGIYVVLLQSDFDSPNDSFDVNFGFYNNSNRKNHKIQPLKKMTNSQKQIFLLKVIMNESLKFHENKHILNDKKSWLKYKTLFQEGGYAYIVYHKAESSQYNIKIELDEKQIKQNGFTLKCTNEAYRNDQDKEDLIYIFSYNFSGQDPSQAQFPPKGFTIKSVI